MKWANTLLNKKNALRIKTTASFLVVAYLLIAPFGSAVFAQNATGGGGGGSNNATWKDSKTIIFGGKEFTGPHRGVLITAGTPHTTPTHYDAASGQCPDQISFVNNTKNDGHDYKSASYASGRKYSLNVNGCSDGNTRSISITPYSAKSAAGSGSGSSTTTPPSKNPPAEAQCDAGAWSFMVCPFITSTQAVLKQLFSMIADLSYFQPLPIGTPKKSPEWAIYYGWSTFLTFANIAAVIGFLVIIFSQATSVGLSSYGVKKLLPKIILVMILMNISYYLCAVAIDISNIIGVAINDVFNYIYTQVTNKLDPSAVNGGIGSGAIAGWFDGVVALAIIVAFFLIPVLITLLVIFGVLAARIAILTLLVIIAPLAFAAWILPNTEKYFKKWWSLFFDMLALYPALMAVYGGATLAANILLLNSQNGGGTFNNILPFVALLVQVMPLIAVPFIIKATSGTLGKVGDMVNQGARKSGGDKLHTGITNARKEYMGVKRKEVGAGLAGKFGKDYDPRKDNGKSRRVRRALGRSVGMAAGLPMRKMDLEERKSNADQAYKTLHEEGKAVNPEGKSAQLANRKFELEQRSSNASRVEQQSLANRLTSDDAFAARAAGVAGEAGVSRVRASAQNTIEQAELEEIKAVKASMVREGVSSDRGALLRRIEQTDDAAVAGAASDLLLETAGTEQYRQALDYDSVRGNRSIADALVKSGRRNFQVIDAKSVDVADLISGSSAVDQVASGTSEDARQQFEATLKADGRIPTLAAEKLIKLEPDAIKRHADRISDEQAYIATLSMNFGSAKAETQKVLRDRAAVWASKQGITPPNAATGIDPSGRQVANPPQGQTPPQSSSESSSPDDQNQPPIPGL